MHTGWEREEGRERKRGDKNPVPYEPFTHDFKQLTLFFGALFWGSLQFTAIHKSLELSETERWRRAKSTGPSGNPRITLMDITDKEEFMTCLS